LIISKEQADQIFRSGTDEWTNYRGIELETK